MRNKKILLTALTVVGTFSVCSCGDVINTTTEPVDKVDPSPTEESKTKEEPKKSPKANIYLAGDSTVKTYSDNQFIGGWGQFLNLYFDEDINVINCAEGGRSSRSFINEGRLYDINDTSFTPKFSQNDGKSIGNSIQKGDYLLIQFGHNDDDTKKEKNYTLLPDRNVPLGEKDANGNYPVTEGKKVSTTTLPAEFEAKASASEKSSALSTISKYGTQYYSYDCGGTYKWYLKQYIDLAKEKGATPVLVTPVARVSFNSDGTLKSGPGLHGENFAYVEAVRQLAKEEDVPLIDMFDNTKTMLETATPTYASYLMALKPNSLTGTWPDDYDLTYGNSSLGYTGIEGTHYNKYGAFISAASLVQSVLNNSEKFGFSDHILKTPKKFYDPSNLMAKSTVKLVEDLFTKVEVTNPLRTYKNPSDVITLIESLPSVDTINDSNYESLKEKLDNVFVEYNKLNVDDRSGVTNYNKYESLLTKYNELVEKNRKVATKTVLLDLSTLSLNQTIDSEVTLGDFAVVGTSEKPVTVKNANISFNYGGKDYVIDKSLSMGGAAKFKTQRYVEFSTEKAARITIVAASTGADDRIIALVNKNDTSKNITTFAANQSTSITSYELEEAGTYQIGSTNKGVYIYQIIIEYFD